MCVHVCTHVHVQIPWSYAHFNVPVCFIMIYFMIINIFYLHQSNLVHYVYLFFQIIEPHSYAFKQERTIKLQVEYLLRSY